MDLTLVGSFYRKALYFYRDFHPFCLNHIVGLSDQLPGWIEIGFFHPVPDARIGIMQSARGQPGFFLGPSAEHQQQDRQAKKHHKNGDWEGL